MLRKILGLLVLVLLLPATALAAAPGGADGVVSFGHQVTVDPGETVTGVVVFGGSVDLQGTDLGDLIIFGGSATVDGQVTGNAVIFGGTIRVNNSVNGDVIVFGASPVIRSRIGGNLVVVGGSAELLDGAEIMGDVYSLGGSTQRSGNAIVHGDVRTGIPSFGGWRFFSGWFDLWRLLSVLFLGLILFWLFPLASGRVAQAVESNPSRTVVAGLLGYLAIVPVIIVLGITLLGIPLIPVFLLAVLLARLLGQVALALLAGRWIIARLRSPGMADWLLVSAGLFGLGLLTLIPLAGTIASLFYGAIGFGAVILTRFGTRSSVA